MGNAVIIAAAGHGRRMQRKKNKQYLPLLGRPLLYYSLAACFQAACFSQVVVAVAPGEEEIFRREVLLPFFPGQDITVVAGGRERQDSVRYGLAVLAADAGYVCVHDGARPLVTADLIIKCLDAAKKYGAAVAAVPVKDTIKVADKDGRVLDTPGRDSLWAVQTPQVFRRSWLETAHDRAFRDGYYATDDAALLEYYGYPVYVTESVYENIKVTTPEDLILAGILLGERGEDACV